MVLRAGDHRAAGLEVVVRARAAAAWRRTPGPRDGCTCSAEPASTATRPAGYSDGVGVGSTVERRPAAARPALTIFTPWPGWCSGRPGCRTSTFWPPYQIAVQSPCWSATTNCWPAGDGAAPVVDRVGAGARWRAGTGRRRAARRRSGAVRTTAKLDGCVWSVQAVVAPVGSSAGQTLDGLLVGGERGGDGHRGADRSPTPCRPADRGAEQAHEVVPVPARSRVPVHAGDAASSGPGTLSWPMMCCAVQRDVVPLRQVLHQSAVAWYCASVYQVAPCAA